METKILNCYSMFFDIGRGDWENYRRTNNQYINDFLMFWGTLEANLTLFCEDYFIIEVTEAIENFKKSNPFKSKVTFEELKKEDLYYFQNISKIVDIQKSSNMRQYSNVSPRSPEYINSEYIAIMFSKPIILQLAKNRGLIPDGTKVIAWADFGIAHCGHNPQYVERIKNKKLLEPNIDKITFFKKQHADIKPDPWYINNFPDNVFTPGGFYLVPVNLIDDYNNGFHKVVSDVFFSQDLVDDDQSIMAVFSSLYSDICNLEDSFKYKDNPPEGDFFPVFYTIENQ